MRLQGETKMMNDLALLHNNEVHEHAQTVTVDNQKQAY